MELKEVYLHIPMAQGCHKYLQFAFVDQVYQFPVPLLGLAAAPLVFMQVVQAVVAHIHKRGMHIWTSGCLLL